MEEQIVHATSRTVVAAWTATAVAAHAARQHRGELPPHTNLQAEIRSAAREFTLNCIRDGLAHFDTVSGNNIDCIALCDSPEDSANENELMRVRMLEVVQSMAAQVAEAAMQQALLQVAKEQEPVGEWQMAQPTSNTSASPPCQATEDLDHRDDENQVACVEAARVQVDKSHTRSNSQLDVASRYVADLFTTAVGIHCASEQTPTPIPLTETEQLFSSASANESQHIPPQVQMGEKNAAVSTATTPPLVNAKSLTLGVVQPPQKKKKKKKPVAPANSRPPKTANDQRHDRPSHREPSRSTSGDDDESGCHSAVPRLRKLEEYMALHPIDRAKKAYNPRRQHYQHSQTPTLPLHETSGYEAESEEVEHQDVLPLSSGLPLHRRVLIPLKGVAKPPSVPASTTAPVDRPDRLGLLNKPKKRSGFCQQCIFEGRPCKISDCLKHQKLSLR